MNAPSLKECALSSCRKQFEPGRADARYCSGACRARASRDRQDEGAGSDAVVARVQKSSTDRAAPAPRKQAAVRARSFATAPLRRSAGAHDVSDLRREVAALAALIKELRRDHEELSEVRSSCDEERDDQLFGFKCRMEDSIEKLTAAVTKLAKRRAQGDPWGGSAPDPAIAELESAILDLRRRARAIEERLEGLIQAILKDTED